jgi:hypothetical protein
MGCMFISEFGKWYFYDPSFEKLLGRRITQAEKDWK